jgi:magnesium transporter
VNLGTAFIASQVIGMFEGTIAQLVPLAALMPIVASIGGNTGNQTVALVVRGLALDQLRIGNAWHLLRKELTVAC